MRRSLIMMFAAASAIAAVAAPAGITGTITTEAGDTNKGLIRWSARDKAYVITKGGVELQVKAAAVAPRSKIVKEYAHLEWDRAAARYLTEAHLAAGNPEKALAAAKEVIDGEKSAAYKGELAPAYWDALLALNRTSTLEDVLAKAASSGDRYSSGMALVKRGDLIFKAGGESSDAAKKARYDELRDLARDFLSKTGLITPKTRFLVNPTGKFVIGGPCGDSGLTGRKIIVDTYGGMASHGGGAFSGKDPSKVDRSAAYYARYAAKNIVAAGLAERCQIQVAYAIGVDRPVSFCVKTFGSTREGVTNAALEKMLAGGEVFDFRPYALTKDLGLVRPSGWCYEDTAAYGHFGRDAFPWEKTDKVARLKKLFA